MDNNENNKNNEEYNKEKSIVELVVDLIFLGILFLFYKYLGRDKYVDIRDYVAMLIIT